MKKISLLLLAILVVGLAGCSTVPETGRHQFLTVASGDEAKMGLSAFDDIKKQEKNSTNAAYNAQVQRVGKRVVASVVKNHPMPDAQWEFVVFESNEVNAFALPGGKVGVYTGLLKLVSCDDELAIVMGHEIAHVTSHHGAERSSQTSALSTLGSIGGAALSLTSYSAATKDAVMSLYGVGAQYGALLPYSRLHESEADEIGMGFAAGAGYDPRAAISFWKKMAQSSGSANQSGLSAVVAKYSSTHPQDADRIAKLEKLLPKNLPVYEQTKRQYM